MFVVLPLFGLVSCLEEESAGPTQEDYEYLQEDVRVLKEDLEKAYLELDENDAKLEALTELEKKAEAAEERAQQIEELQKEKEEAEEQIRNLRKEFDDYQKKYEAKVRSEAEGQEFASLDLGDRTLKGVVISSVTETAIKIRHADGFATLNSKTAPPEWAERFFLRSEDEIAEQAAQLAAFLAPPQDEELVEEKPTRPPSVYQQRRLEREAEEEALKSFGPKYATAIVAISGQNAKGTGFFAQEGITTYLYTSAKLLDKNPGVAITDVNGKEWKQFGELEVSTKHDMVRMAVTEPVELAFELHPIGSEVEVGTTIAAFSLIKGSTLPRQTESRLRSVQDDLYDFSSSDLVSFVGGPMLNSEGKVVALLTRPQVVRRDIFDDVGKSYERVRPIACRLDLEQKWEKTTLNRFLATGKILTAYDQGSLYLHALSQISPSSSGVNLNSRVRNGQSIEQVLAASKESQALEQLKRVHKDLSSGRKISQRDINKKFRLIFQAAVNNAQSEALDEKHFSAYHQGEVRVSQQFRDKAFSELKQKLESVR